MSEYDAEIVRLPETYFLEGCDNVKGASLYGLQAIVSKDAEPGTLGVLFVTESKLSEEYLRENNLYRDAKLNKDPNAKGYFELNGRVRAQKFRGHVSNAFWMPISSLDYISGERALWDESWEGLRFSELSGHEICSKYIPKGVKGPSVTAKSERRVSEKFFPRHADTSNFFRNLDKIPLDATLVVTQKLHGTSIRIGKVLVRRKLGWFSRLVRKLGVPVQETAYELVAGSRRVIKDQQAGDGGFYENDVYTSKALEVADKIPEGFVVYGELIGWASDDQAIQKGYTYQVPRGLNQLYVYRVTFINPQGLQTDLSWDGVKEFCSTHGFKFVPEITTVNLPNDWLPIEDVAEGIRKDLLDVRLETWDQTMIPLEQDNPCDEGVVIRVEGLTPTFYKAKSPKFLEHETKVLDEGVPDMEEVG